jgi:hypothetical protein
LSIRPEQENSGFSETLRVEDIDFGLFLTALAFTEWRLGSGHDQLFRLMGKYDRSCNVVMINYCVNHIRPLIDLAFRLLIFPQLRPMVVNLQIQQPNLLLNRFGYGFNGELLLYLHALYEYKSTWISLR